MVSRPGRPKAADISDETALEAAEDFHVRRGAHPIDALVAQGHLQKVAGAKLHKLVDRGWLTRGSYSLTHDGCEVLKGFSLGLTLAEMKAQKEAVQ